MAASQSAQPPPHKRARVHAERDNHVSSPRKRTRVHPERDNDDFMRGNIIKIRLHNFMTYSDITTNPGPRLNLVIGPNGTGKSSLVCAIAIGLGGEPQLLGRAGHIGDYVKRGEESGTVEISLRGDSPDETIVITRKINKQNKSDWLINGRPASKRTVQETVQRLNIQVNNLTQFLPQDRVCEFAKMTPIQLLEETEKAVGDPELSQQHEKLITLNEDLKQRQVTVMQLESTLTKHQSNNAELEKDVERVQERNRLFSKAEEMKKKLPWLKYDREKNTYQDAKEREKEAKRKLQQLLEQVATCKEPIQEKKILKGKAESACKKLRDALANLESKRREIRRKENELRAQMNAKMVEIEDLRRSEANRVEKLRQARLMVTEAEQELANLPVVEPQTAESEELGKQISEIELSIQEKKRSLHECTLQERQKLSEMERCDRRITEIQSVTNQRLQLLKSSGLAPKIFEAYGWVQQNKNQFKREVYGPVLLEVNIPNRELAAFVEGQVAGYIWKSFITQDREDRDLLVRNLKQFECPVINFTGEDTPSPETPLTMEMKRLGIKGRLDEVIAAPQVVKDVLVGQFNLNLSYVGNAETNRRAEEARDLGIRDLWTPENHYRWQESRYTGQVSAFVNPVRPARLFSPRVDTTELEQIQRRRAEAEGAAARFKEQKRTLADEQRQLEDQEAVFQRQREEIVNRVRFERRKRQEMQSKIEQRRRKLRSLEEEEDVRTAIQRLRAAVNDLNAKRCNKVIELKELLIKSATDHMTQTVQSLVVAELDAIVKHMEKEIHVQERLALQAQQAHDDCKEELQQCRRKLEEAKNYAESIARITPELSAAFQEMPDTVEELEDTIENYIAQAHAVLCQNPNVLEEYERRCQQIKDVSANLEAERKSLDFCTTEMDRIQTTWLTTLRELVSRINTSFSRNFSEMAVAGEVSLDEHGTEFDKYGIHIKVKFRETGELQVLSAHHQSGGERSVSTILYLVSIQDLTHCPFRVVDEINQGMDPINERKMFQQLVRAASQPNTPQCFLLTPKLLPDLDYSDACSVLYIMNGPWIDAPSELWKTGESWSQINANRCR